MPHINLLPWREDLRRERQRQFINVAAGSAVLMLGIILLVHLRISGIIDGQNGRNTFLKNHIVKIDKEIEEIESLEKEKSALLSRMKIIQELQGSRPEIVHIIDEIAKTIPEKAFLLKVARTNTTISMEGIADSNDYVSQLMRKLNDSPWFKNPKLTVIESGKKDYPTASWFQLTVSQDSPKSKEETDK